MSISDKKPTLVKKIVAVGANNVTPIENGKISRPIRRRHIYNGHHNHHSYNNSKFDPIILFQLQFKRKMTSKILVRWL